MCPHSLSLDDAILFFDLAGTVVERNAAVTERVGRALHAVGQRLKRLVMVTGQPRDDAQVKAMLALLATCPAAESAYLTRGGVRVSRVGGSFCLDTDYTHCFALLPAVVDHIHSVISQALVETKIEPLIPVCLLDGVTVRVNADPQRRAQLIASLRPRLTGLRVEAEGRTSIYIASERLGKHTAVRYELDGAVVKGPSYYLGNEVASGNDRPVLSVDGVEVLAVGDCGVVPANAKCRTIARSVTQVLDLLEASA